MQCDVKASGVMGVGRWRVCSSTRRQNPSFWKGAMRSYASSSIATRGKSEAGIAFAYIPGAVTAQIVVGEETKILCLAGLAKMHFTIVGGPVDGEWRCDADADAAVRGRGILASFPRRIGGCNDECGGPSAAVFVGTAGCDSRAWEVRRTPFGGTSTRSSAAWLDDGRSVGWLVRE